MTNENKYTLAATGGALVGVGFTKIDADLMVGGILIASGVVLQILVAVLQKHGLPVSAPPQG